MSLSASELIGLLGLKPHPTCGFVTEAYRSTHRIAAQALPGGCEGDRPLEDRPLGERPLGSVLYFLVTPEAQIRLHRIRSEQMYHHSWATHWRCCCSTPTAREKSW